MNLKEFKSKATKEEYNTNNAWGFGGAIGFCYSLGNLKWYNIKACYRHTKSHSIDRYHINSKAVTKDEFILKLKDL